MRSAVAYHRRMQFTSVFPHPFPAIPSLFMRAALGSRSVSFLEKAVYSEVIATIQSLKWECMGMQTLEEWHMRAWSKFVSTTPCRLYR